MRTSFVLGFVAASCFALYVAQSSLAGDSESSCAKGAAVTAEAGCCGGQKACSGEEKLAALLGQWKTALASVDAGCPTKRAEVAQRLTSIEADCPIGSRMAETLAFTRNVLSKSVAADPSCAAGAEKAHGNASAEGCEGTKMLQARSSMARGLATLTSYALEGINVASGRSAPKASGGCTGATSEVSTSTASCCSKAAATEAAAGTECSKTTGDSCAKAEASVASGCCAKAQAPATAGCPAQPGASIATTASGTSGCCAGNGPACAGCPHKGSCDGSCAGKCEGGACTKALNTAASDCQAKTSCPKALMATATALKASWERVPGEYASMCPDRKKEVLAAMEQVSKDSQVVGLLPETVLLLADGVARLDGVHATIRDYVKAHPEVHQGLPAETVTAFEDQARLVHEAAEVLARVKAGLAALQTDNQPQKEAVVLQQ